MLNDDLTNRQTAKQKERKWAGESDNQITFFVHSWRRDS